MKSEEAGSWAFIIGVVIALLAGLMGVANYWVIVGLLLLGLIIGFVNVTRKESTNFLIAMIALLVVGSAGGLQVFATLPFGSLIAAILGNLVALLTPAVTIVALKAAWEVAKKK